MRPETGLILRVVGPLIEFACVFALVSNRGRGRTVGGVPLDNVLYAGILFGLILVVAGLALGPFRTRRRDLYDKDDADRS
ncbi:MAG TPA: hypothetical protein VG406_07170 [Isosphaeraceae bacterium]|jgi:hypothetical protein|nr:hypothetical protein [Isosphaeraceae bacterium]